MHLSDFDYDLPDELIARHPLPERSGSRLLHVPATGPARDRMVRDLPDLLAAGDVLVVNDTRVIKARLRGQRDSGGAVEGLIERVTGVHTALVQLRASNSPKAGAGLRFADGAVRAVVEGREGPLFVLRFDAPVLAMLEQHGELPIPPYFERRADASDDERYQTVFHDPAKAASVAAPTAGLHLDEPLLQALQARGIAVAKVTLHVGAGTFAPVRVDDITQHQMHSEWAEVSADAVTAIRAAQARGGRVVAVGTTATRALESAAQAHGGVLAPWAGETRIFMYPGFDFRVVDMLLTNFHLPRSTLLMLVSAFVGRERVLAAYRHAIAQRYRFFSYGDAMLLARVPA